MACTDDEGKYVPEGSPRGVLTAPLTIREDSNIVLTFPLKAARPEKYRERYHRSVAGGRLYTSAGDAPSTMLGHTENTVSFRLAALSLLDRKDGGCVMRRERAGEVPFA